MVSDLHMYKRTIQRHIWKEGKPSYADVTLYAVCFHCLSYRDVLWKMVKKDWEDE